VIGAGGGGGGGGGSDGCGCFISPLLASMAVREYGPENVPRSLRRSNTVSDPDYTLARCSLIPR